MAEGCSWYRCASSEIVSGLGTTATDSAEEQYWQCSRTYSVTLSHCHTTIIALEKAIIVAYSGCVFVALSIQHTKRAPCIIMCGLSGSAAFFPTLSHKRHYFRGGGGEVTEHKMICFL
jgi:hypothetical protein